MAGRIVFGIFPDRSRADNAIDDLAESGYNTKDVSVIMRSEDMGVERQPKEMATAGMAGGVVSGATAGGIIGGIAGLLIGLGAITIPGIGVLLIGGPLAAALGLTGAAAATISGAVTGALAGGLVGALVGLGMPEETAREYENRIRRGEILLAVSADKRDEGEIKTILERNGAEEVVTVSS